MPKAVSCWCRPFLLLAILCVVALPAWAISSGGDPGPVKEERTSPVSRSAVQGNQAPGKDVEGGPLTEGEQFRRWTRITPAETRAADPHFRHWVELIQQGRADKRIMRLYWFYRSRLEPFDDLFPVNWRRAAIERLRDDARNEEMTRRFEERREAAASPRLNEGVGTPPGDTLEASRRHETGPTTDGTDAGGGISARGVWVPVGPFNIAGRTMGLDRPDGEPDTLYAAVADGGVWRTRDRGATWERLTDFEETLSGGSILLDPTDPRTIYFGTGEGNGAIDNYAGIGVLKSTDEGLTWSKSNLFSSSVRRLAMHPSEPQRIYAAGDQGCYLSADGGATFNLINAPGLPTGTGSSDVLVRPDNPDWVYCAIWGGSNGGIYRSMDHGANWSLLSNGLPSPGSAGRISLAVSRSNPDVLIAGVDQNNGEIYRTDDGGDTWFRPKSGSPLAYCGGQCWYDNVVGIDSADPNVLYAGGVSAYKSTDGGVNWINMSSGVHVDHHFVMTPAAGEVILANDGGIYHSSNYGGSWAEWSLGMDTAQYYGICRHPTDDYWAFGGTQDNGSHRRRLSDGWKEVLGADGGMCMSGPAGTSIVLGEMQNQAMRRSTNGGDGWSDATDGIGKDDPRAWVGIMVADPSDRHNMWTGTNKVYRSKDAKATAWENVGNNLYCASIIGCMSVTAIEVAPSDSNTVYVGFRAQAPVPNVTPGLPGGVFRTTNALDVTVNWTDLTGSDFPFRSVRRIRVHPDDPNTVYVVFSGLGTGKIRKSADAGVTWTDHTGDLPDIPVNDLVVDADNPGTLLAATDLGVYRSDDDGTTWYGFSSGLPTAAAIEFTHNCSTGTLRVGTHGRSVWEWQSASDVPTAVPDGRTVSGSQMTAVRLDAATMRVFWDVRTCTAQRYNLFYGDLDDVATRAYSGADCDLGTSGRADVPIPVTPSGDVFFVIAASDGAGTEGPHGYDAAGDPVGANGIGFCGITAQDSLATCP